MFIQFGLAERALNGNVIYNSTVLTGPGGIAGIYRKLHNQFEFPYFLPGEDSAVKQRLHQASFRRAVITAYNGRCALSGLPEPLPLDAAHIVPDNHEQLSQAAVLNGIPPSKIYYCTQKSQSFNGNGYAMRASTNGSNGRKDCVELYMGKPVQHSAPRLS